MDDPRAVDEIDYGQDAPGVRFGMIVVAGAGAGLLAIGWFARLRWHGAPWWLPLPFAVLGWVALLYGAGMSTYMTWSSKVGKLRARDALLARADQLRPWRGDEVVVDVGCGRGLMLIGAARRLDRGTAIGFDIWRSQDQQGASPEAVMKNARLAGVSERIQIQTGDARSLPLLDASVDVVLSHWMVHNIESDNDRSRALDEMWRVLRPGGVLIVADIEHVPTYARHFSSAGARPCDLMDGGWEARIMGALSGGTYRPQALVCAKPAE